MNAYTQLTEKQRYLIEHFIKAGFSQTEISNNLEVHKSTISTVEPMFGVIKHVLGVWPVFYARDQGGEQGVESGMYRLQPEEDVHIEDGLERGETKTGELTATHT